VTAIASRLSAAKYAAIGSGRSRRSLISNLHRLIDVTKMTISIHKIMAYS
jgi:hypothetical protein